MTIDLFSYDDYRSFIKDYVHGSESNWGLWAKLAKASGCQAPYLTQVIKGRAQLTADHVMGLAEYLDMSGEEVDFFLTLLELARASTPKFKGHLQAKIRKIRQSREN